MDKNGKPRILMVAPRYYPYIGGTEAHVHEVAGRLAASGIDLTLLTTVLRFSKEASSLPAKESINGVSVIRVPAWPPRRDYYLAPALIPIIRHGKWDLIHCQSCHTFVPMLAMLAARTAHIPYVVTFHAGGHSSHLRTRLRGVQWRVLRPLLAHASKLIGVSQFEVDYFRDMLHLPAKKFIVVPNGAVLPEVPLVPEKSPEQALIISSGRLEQYKGHQRLIAALPEIRKWRPDARLLILGTGPYEAELHALAQSIGMSEYVDIRAIPADDRRAMAELLTQAALVTLLSEYESQGIAVIEALALRRPVLVADTSALSELARRGFARAVPLESSAEEIALAVRQQIEEPIMPSADWTLPTWDDCAAQIQDVYASVW